MLLNITFRVHYKKKKYSFDSNFRLTPPTPPPPPPPPPNTHNNNNKQTHDRMFPSMEPPTRPKYWVTSRFVLEVGWVFFYVHRNRRLIRDGSPGRPPWLSHSSWALSYLNRKHEDCPPPRLHFPTLLVLPQCTLTRQNQLHGASFAPSNVKIAPAAWLGSFDTKGVISTKGSNLTGFLSFFSSFFFFFFFLVIGIWVAFGEERNAMRFLFVCFWGRGGGVLPGRMVKPV